MLRMMKEVFSHSISFKNYSNVRSFFRTSSMIRQPLIWSNRGRSIWKTRTQRGTRKLLNRWKKWSTLFLNLHWLLLRKKFKSLREISKTHTDTTWKIHRKKSYLRKSRKAQNNISRTTRRRWLCRWETLVKWTREKPWPSRNKCSQFKSTYYVICMKTFQSLSVLRNISWSSPCSRTHYSCAQGLTPTHLRLFLLSRNFTKTQSSRKWLSRAKWHIRKFRKKPRKGEDFELFK